MSQSPLVIRDRRQWFNTDVVLSERARIVLAHAFGPSNTVSKAEFYSKSLKSPGGVELEFLDIPLTNSDTTRNLRHYETHIKSLRIFGSQSSNHDIDVFPFYFEEGDIVTVDARVNIFLANETQGYFDPWLFLYHVDPEDGTRVQVDENDDHSELYDSILLDNHISKSGLYEVHLRNYEITDFDFNVVEGVPAPYDLLVYALSPSKKKSKSPKTPKAGENQAGRKLKLNNGRRSGARHA